MLFQESPRTRSQTTRPRGQVAIRRTLSALAVAALASAASAATTSWIDHFATLNTALWFVSNGWSNGSWTLNEWTSSQIATGRSGLTVTLNKNPTGSAYPYSSGEIQTRSAHQYGYYQARIQAASGSGLDTGFFTYTGSPWNEIDVEILGKNTRAVSLTYHNGSQQIGTSVPLSFDASTSAHLFGFDWQPQYIRWYVDNKLVLQETGSQLALPAAPQKLYFDMWASNSFASWLGLFTWPGHPITSHVTCMSVSPSFATRLTC